MSGNARYFAGIDAGGSKALAVVVDERGQELGRGIAGSANYHRVGIDLAAEHVREALDVAIRAAGGRLPLAGLWVGMAGVDRAEDRDIWLPRLQPLAITVLLTNDAELILSALEGGAGVGLIAGTGSIAFGRDQQGALARAGGWGYIMGDEGSGYDIARQALRAAARAADRRGPETALLGSLMAYWGVERPYDLIGRIYQAQEPATLARLAGLALEAARAGDPVAQRIIAAAADELALAALTVAANLQFPDGRLSLALGGGLLVNDRGFRAEVVRRISEARAVSDVAVVKDAALSAAQAAARLPAPGEIKGPHSAHGRAGETSGEH